VATVADLILARQHDLHPAILFEDESYTYAEFAAASAARAALAAALKPGGGREDEDDRPFHIGVLLENTPEFLFWIGGAALAGAAVVGINPTRRGAELAADIRHTDCQLIVTDSTGLGLLAGLDIDVSRDRILLIDGPEYKGLLRHEARIDASPSERSILLLLFTSGSTGAPKAVICTQGRLAVTAETASSLLGLTRDDVTYQSMPLFHGNAIMANWLPALRWGATVALRRKFSASGFLADVQKYRATYFNYVGRALAYILATPPTRYDRDNQLRLAFGTEASTRDMERFVERYDCQIIESYGSSEGVMSIRRRPDSPPASIGLPASDTMDVIIADRTTGKECPRARFDEHGRITNGDEAIGEIVNRSGASSFEGYYKNDAAMADRLSRGWYWSGDLGYRDLDGWFYFAGRGSDWLRVDSENFAAAPIERILFRYPGVLMAGVYPVADSRTGDQVMAALEFEGGDEVGSTFDPDAFLAFLSDQPDLGTKWAPRFVRIVNNMPLTGTNKINKQPLRVEQWVTTDPVFWAEEPGGPYRLLTAHDRKELRRQFEAHGRSHLLPGEMLPGE